jgi:hypothetical protein
MVDDMGEANVFGHQKVRWTHKEEDTAVIVVVIVNP